MFRFSSEALLSCAAVGCVAAALLVAPSPGKFSAGGECTFTTVDGAHCDDTKGGTCNHGVTKCSSGTAYKTCTDGTGQATDCENFGNCKDSAGLKYPTTNNTGC